MNDETLCNITVMMPKILQIGWHVDFRDHLERQNAVNFDPAFLAGNHNSSGKSTMSSLSIH